MGRNDHILQGPLLVGLITSVCSAGFLLFGYDQGVMSGVIISPQWLDTVNHPSSLMIGTITALYDVGAVFGAISASFTSEPMGRKRTLLLGAAILMIGAILMSSSYERVQFMVGRVVTGIGIGYITSVTPVYQAEISSREQRGWQVCCQLTTMLVGLMLAYWVNYGVFDYATSFQWRFPLAFQCAFAVYISIMTPFLPDTPRWLLRHRESPEQGIQVLSRLRGKAPSDPSIQFETKQILSAIELESAQEGSWTDLFYSSSSSSTSSSLSAHKRFYLAVGVQFMQQMTGINIVTYYAPTLYTSSLGFSDRQSLFLGSFTQVWYVLASFVTWFTIDRVGRRKLFISMALGMCCVLVVEAICVKVNSDTGSTASAVVAVVMVFLFEACFTWGWMATVWIYPPEILPLKIRAKGASLAAAADFLGNFLVVEVTPVGLEKIGYKFYIVWAVLNVVNAIVVFLFYPETGGLQLEAVDELFVQSRSAIGMEAVDGKGWHRRLQWSIVPKSLEAVRKAKMMHHEDQSDSTTDPEERTLAGDEVGIDGKNNSRNASHVE